MAKATGIILTKRGHTLVAEDAAYQDYLDKIANGQQVKVVLTVPRNIRHHRLLFAVLNIVVEAQQEPRVFKEAHDLLKTIQRAMDYVHDETRIQAVKDPFTGKYTFQTFTVSVEDSIAFENMGQVEFKTFFDTLIKFVLENVLPLCPREGIEDEIYHALGERSPNDWRI